MLTLEHLEDTNNHTEKRKKIPAILLSKTNNDFQCSV